VCFRSVVNGILNRRCGRCGNTVIKLKIALFLLDFRLMKKAASPSEMSIYFYQTIRHYIPKVSSLN